MLTHFIQSINWVDVGLAALFVRIVFISVRTGFVTEFFKLLGVFIAFLAAFHYYSAPAAMMSQKTTLPISSWQLLIFIAINGATVFLFKFLRDTLLVLFKVETTHKGFDQYAGGLLGGARAIFVVSVVLFGLLLVNHKEVHRQAMKSWSYKLCAYAAPNTYTFVHEHVMSKLFEGQKLNANVFAVVSGHGAHSE